MMKSPLYIQIYETLKKRIIEGHYKINEKLPADAILAEEFRVSNITLKKALDLLKKDGYISRRPRIGTIIIHNHPNPVGDFQESSIPIIGCILTNFDDIFGTKILSGILAASQKKAQILIHKSLGDIKMEETIIRSFTEMNVSGIILQPVNSEYVSPSVLDLATKQFPMVVLDRSLETLPVSSISSDNVHAAQKLTSHLLSQGHKHIAMITSKSEVSTVANRMTGFVLAHASYHYTYNPAYVFQDVESVIPDSDRPIQSDIEKIKTFLLAHPEITAVVASEYNIALLIKQACHQLGKRFPAELSIACFDHPDNFFDQEAFRFTHIRQRQYDMGMNALEMLLEQIENPSDVHKELLDFDLVEGDSIVKLIET